jgi:Trypsin-co-occurring domain 1
MSKLQPIQLEDGTMIYVEASEDVVAAPIAESDGAEPDEVSRTGQKGLRDAMGRASAQGLEASVQSFNAIESTIKTYTKYTLNAFNDAALANVEKVTLEFGMNVSGGAGVPYIAAGTVNCNIKVTVECSFPERQAEQQSARQAVAKVTQQTQQLTPQQAQQVSQQATRTAPAMPQSGQSAPR